jgi:hypothetical protein
MLACALAGGTNQDGAKADSSAVGQTLSCGLPPRSAFGKAFVFFSTVVAK